MDALRHEASVSRAVRAVGALLIAQPAATLPGRCLKLVVLLALHAPGGACDTAEPWRSLSGLLADLTLLWQNKGTRAAFADSHSTAMGVGARDVGCWRMA
ncbi:hypothetical protein [Methylobacterium sp. ARG-1]|uniref:hypothetical protein n=1 Tax=Methylobacterium sp. ARG-1 TaxID=1692501 RepID=UPI000AE6FD0C|nr:hypothetical protein [Methylobacterium sp. ARG-1]